MYICTSKQNQTYENKVASALTMTGPVLCVDSNYFWDSVSNYEQFQNMRKVIFSLRIVVMPLVVMSYNMPCHVLGVPLPLAVPLRQKRQRDIETEHV